MTHLGQVLLARLYRERLRRENSSNYAARGHSPNQL